MAKLKKLLTNWKVILYIFVFIVTLFAINPRPWNSGVAIRNVALNSTAYLNELRSPSPTDMPMVRQRIVALNNVPVNSIGEFDSLIQTLPINSTLTVKTEKLRSGIFKEESTYVMKFTSVDELGLTVYDAPKNNIVLGLDLQGGTRVVLQPEKKVSAEDMGYIIDNMKNRIKVYGLSDVVVRDANDLLGNQFIIVEVAGANEEEVKDLLARQGKFEAKVGNQTVFLGGKDITYVCRTADCSGINPQYGCSAFSEGYSCQFYFAISLDQSAADRLAEETDKLNIVYDQVGQAYLEKNIDLYLDDGLVDSLRIGSELKGNSVTDIQISGSGVGVDRRSAIADSTNSMKKLQTVLITGSLPVKLEVIKTDTLSPSLGKEFLRNAVLIGILSEIAVTLIILARYRKIKIAIPIILVISSEILLILGLPIIFTFIKQPLDIAAIAGIIVAIGTGVDDQIIITDEILSGESSDKKKYLAWSKRLKKAFFMVIAAYFATIAAMFPLLFAGAELLKGFAVTTIIGVTSGVLITRPAFAVMMRVLLEKE